MPNLQIRELGAETSIPLADEEVTIGRSRNCTIRLQAEQASRVHCRIRKESTGYVLHDADSSNGTFVNGEETKEHLLKDGDSIGIGQALIIFREEDPLPWPGSDVVTQAIPIRDPSVQILLETIIQAPRMADTHRFLELAVDNVIQITRAERGILFEPDEKGELVPLVARSNHRENMEEVSGISRSIPQQVFKQAKAIYLLDTQSDHDEIESHSVSLYQLRTVMCAPLRVGPKTTGVLYVDSRAKSGEYNEEHLALFEAVAGYLALSLENLRAVEEEKRNEKEQRRRLESENLMLRRALEERRHLIGESAPMKGVYDTVRKVAPTNATVLITGESGTGKEAIAHVLHELSPRSEHPMVIIDCAAIPETLLESELFGYEKGAFTGAESRKQGKMEAAQGGTLFLDEIGELSPALQVKLLRALEQRTIVRVGGVEPIRIDVRLLAATNRDLDEMVRQETFRKDLLFRLRVVHVELPPLNRRGEDILLLASSFLTELGKANGRTVIDFTEDAKNAMRSHRWEGNVRELRHRVEQAVILSNHEYISTDDLNLSGEGGVFHALETAREIFEKSYLIKALVRNEYNVTHTARELAISRQHLQNLMKKYTLRKPEPPPNS